MIVISPATLLGQTSAAILHTQGGVWVNQYEAKDASAIFPGDSIETKISFTGQLTLDGSSVLIQPESVGKFQGDLLELDHGSVSVSTLKSFQVQVKCLTVVPVANVQTQYDVTDINGTIHVAANKGDVNVQRHQHDAPGKVAPGESSNDASVHEGEQKSYSESEMCGAPARLPGTSQLNPKWIAAGAAGAGVLIWVLIHGGGSNPPDMSQAKP